MAPPAAGRALHSAVAGWAEQRNEYWYEYAATAILRTVYAANNSRRRRRTIAAINNGELDRGQGRDVLRRC